MSPAPQGIFRAYDVRGLVDRELDEEVVQLVGRSFGTLVRRAGGRSVVLGRDGGVMFIPAQLAEKVVTSSELVRLRDMFGHQRLREGVYTSGQIDRRWSDEIERDFTGWLRERIDDLPVPREQVQKFIDERSR